MSNNTYTCGICEEFQTNDWPEFQSHRALEILALIEENGGPKGLDLREKDLSRIELGLRTIREHLEEVRNKSPQKTPVWLSQETGGIAVDLRGVDLREADLRGATMEQADLRGANLEGADLRRTNLQGAHLEGVDLSGTRATVEILTHDWSKPLSLEPSTEGLEGAYFYNACLEYTRLKREHLGTAIGEELAEEYDRAKEAYLNLKNNFAAIGRHEDESWAYVKVLQMGRTIHHPRNARKYFAESEKLPENSTWHSWAWWRFYGYHTSRWLLDGLIILQARMLGFHKERSTIYRNGVWGFSLELGQKWYEPKGYRQLFAGVPPSTDRAPLFRHVSHPVQANIQIGAMPRIPSWEESSRFAKKRMMNRGYSVLGEHHFQVLGIDHYAISYLLRGNIPTRKYSLVFQHPTRNEPIEFVFTVSVYSSQEDFERFIKEGDELVRSFQWSD